MNIEELDAYNLDDAVKFHDHLNPRLWDDREQLRPEVRAKLLEIAADFEEFLGLNDVSVQDITISGSNAAYSYTNHSDIDLHLVVAMPQGSGADVYRELFDAKKYQYNDLHNIRIGNADVELYVQDADQPHHSQGIYSVRNNEWISVPRRRSADVNDSAVQRKYQDLGTRIEHILNSSDHEQLARMMTKIKTMRAAGLEREGEFGVDNIVFKLLRNNGLIKRLVDARGAARDAELSLNERKRKKKSSRVRYGYGGYWTPGYNFGGTELGGDSGGGDGGGESVHEASTPDGVSASTKMFLEQDSASTTDIVRDFVDFCVGELGIEQQPQLRLRRDPAWSQRNHSFGQFDTASNQLNVSMANRHVMDILRTVAHELVHHHQQEQQDLPPNAGETGSEYENEANARAGELMRNYGQQHPELFEPSAVSEGWRGRVGSAALAAACVAGTSGCATTGQLAQGAQIAARTAQTMQGRDIKGMARAELEQEIRNLARAQRGDANAQNLSRIYQLQQRQQQQNESSGYIPTKKERNDPRFSMALSPDVQPGATGKEANKLNLKTNSQGQPELLMKGLANALREFKETGKLPSRAAEDYSADQPPGPESKPTMPAGTVKVDVSDVYDWYKLGQHISNMKGLGKHDFGQGAPSAILSFGDEETEHKYIKDLEATGLTTTDIDPVDPNQPPDMPRQKTDPTYNVGEAFDNAYATKWRKNKGDYSIVAKMADGNYLNILFNRGNQGPMGDEYNIEFQRNNSVDVTREGDAQRVFATVLATIKEFVEKVNPLIITFTAEKSQDPTQADGRTSLYNRLVNRYAEGLGYYVDTHDRGDAEYFTLTRKNRDVAENFAAESSGIETYPIPLPIGDYLGPDPEFAPPGNYKDSGDLEEEVHDLMDAGVVPKVTVAYPKSLLATQDWLSNEGGSPPLFPEYPDRPVVYEKAGKYYILDGHHRVTKAFKAGSPIRVYFFRDTDLKENFADGKNPQDKGDSARHGIPKKASISSLRKIAKQGGRKGQLAHWQANMRSGRAKANETIAESEQLMEINMSPGSLRSLAAQTGAIAGMEFEMIVPGIEGVEVEELEPNYDDYDENVTSIDDAANFFNDGDYNGRREIQRLRDSMSEDYQTWLGEAWMEHFETYKNTIVFRFGKENWEEAQIAEILGLDEAETEALETRGASPEDYMDAAEKVIADGLDPWLNDAQEDAKDEYYDEDHQDDWLASEGLNYMSDVERQYEISWPHWTSDGSDAGIESVADDFASAIGRKTNWSSSYHGGKREPNAYVVEPDGSLVPGDEDDAGLEFVSPPLPIDDMLSDLNKVKAWADGRGCYTSAAAKTGLHINVSVPNFDAKKLDYVKLALLLGDQYVLEQFGRTGNQYAKSALDIVKTRVQERPGDAALLLNKMRDNLGALATKAIHTGDTSKFTSINTKTGYIEFRGPGGDWLDENFDKIENTLLRFVVALDAAMDPQKYRDEYLKKLYKALNPAGNKAGQQNPYGEMIQEFSKYMASLQGDANEASGRLNKETQQSILDFRRAVAAELAQPTPGTFTAAPSNYKIYRITDGQVMDTFYAANNASAEDQFRDWLMSPAAGASDNFRYAPVDTVIRGDTGSAAATTTASATATNTLTPRGPGPWEIYRISDNASVREIGHTNRAAAETEARSALGLRGEAPELYGVRTRPGATTPRPDIIDIEPDVEQNFIPGSTLDLQRQRQQAAQQPAGTFRGTWAIKDNRGNTLHTFSGIGNSQADANRVAAGWLAQQGYQAGLEVEVVPVMEP